MKKMLRSMLALCLIFALLPAQTVLAISDAAEKTMVNALSWMYHYDESQDAFTAGAWCILATAGTENYVISALPNPQDDHTDTVFYTAKDDGYYCAFDFAINEKIYFYEANSDLGKADGFVSIGYVTEGETVYIYVGTDDDGSHVIYDAIAVDYNNGILTLDGISGNSDETLPVYNSDYELCAVYYEELCYSLLTDEDTFYGNAPAETEPPATEAPRDEPEETKPAASQEEKRVFDVELPELDDLHADAIVQKKGDRTGMIVIGGCVAAAIVLLAAVLIISRKKKKVAVELNDAEEGTKLADGPYEVWRLQRFDGKSLLIGDTTRIGRAPDNDLVIPQNATIVSGHHCEIIDSGDGMYLRDLGSTNGTFVNGQKLPTGQRVKLRDGMKISLGGAQSTVCFTVVVMFED